MLHDHAQPLSSGHSPVSQPRAGKNPSGLQGLCGKPGQPHARGDGDIVARGELRSHCPRRRTPLQGSSVHWPQPERAGIPREQWVRWVHPSWQQAGWGFADERGWGTGMSMVLVARQEGDGQECPWYSWRGKKVTDRNVRPTGEARIGQMTEDARISLPFPRTSDREAIAVIQPVRSVQGLPSEGGWSRSANS